MDEQLNTKYVVMLNLIEDNKSVKSVILEISQIENFQNCKFT